MGRGLVSVALILASAASTGAQTTGRKAPAVVEGHLDGADGVRPAAFRAAAESFLGGSFPKDAQVIGKTGGK